MIDNICIVNDYFHLKQLVNQDKVFKCLELEFLKNNPQEHFLELDIV